MKKRPSQRQQDIVNKIIAWGGDGSERGISVYFASRLERYTNALIVLTCVLAILALIQIILLVVNQ